MPHSTCEVNNDVNTNYSNNMISTVSVFNFKIIKSIAILTNADVGNAVLVVCVFHVASK